MHTVLHRHIRLSNKNNNIDIIFIHCVGKNNDGGEGGMAVCGAAVGWGWLPHINLTALILA